MIVLAGDLQENVAVKIAVPTIVGIVLMVSVITGISIGLYFHYRRKPTFV